MLSRVMDSGSEPETTASQGRPGDGGVGLGTVEAPRGRLCYRLEVHAGRVRAASLTTPSQLNWPAVPLALEQRNILQDFPIIDASFSLAVSALDL
jgi:Ni,Fe-hydrogenase III large subunit